MRARGIKPGFYKNEELAECSFAARLLAPALWMMADREGRLEDRPKRIKGEVFPYDNIDTEALLQELVGAGHILRYAVDGKRYIQVIAFAEHQTPHSREKESDIPAFTGHETAKNEIKHDLGSASHPLILFPDSVSLIPDSISCFVPNGTPQDRVDSPEANRPPAEPSAFLKEKPAELPEDWQDHPLPPANVIEMWNHLIIGEKNTQSHVRLTPERKKIIVARSRDLLPLGRDWLAHFERIRGDPFTSGENERGWRAGIDWALKKQSIIKMMEGGYRGK